VVVAEVVTVLMERLEAVEAVEPALDQTLQLVEVELRIQEVVLEVVEEIVVL
jgi:hypothetical protein